MNNNQDSFSFQGRVKSFKHAFDGIYGLIKSQHNAWIHLVATSCVVLIGLLLNVSNIEWCILIFAIVSVWVAEALNTAIEFLCDVVSTEFHPLIKKSKDIAAGAVLITATGSLIVGLIIFLPYFF